MKVTVMRPVEIEVATLRVNVPVRYGTEDIATDCPGRRPWREGDTDHGADDRWDVIIDIDTGRIVNWWPAGKAVTVDMKVCDEGVYVLYDAAGDEVARIEGYVPDCVPGRYGDYVSFDIDSNGVVQNWEPDPDAFRRMAQSADEAA